MVTPFHGPAGPAPPRERRRLRDFISIFQYSGRAVALVWTTSRLLTLLLVFLSLAAGVLPALVAYVGKWLVDAVVAATASDGDGSRAAGAARIAATTASTIKDPTYATPAGSMPAARVRSASAMLSARFVVQTSSSA